MTSKKLPIYLSLLCVLSYMLISCNSPIQFKATIDKSGMGTGSNSGTSIGGGSGGAGGGGLPTSTGCQLSNVKVPVKIMFVVDTSGSNSTPTMNKGTLSCDPTMNTCAPATDPTKSFRSGSITSFFNIYSARTNLSWGFITFANDQTKALISSGFGNAANMQTAIAAFNSSADGGDTPYLQALSQVQSAIANDPGLSLTGASAPLYYVVFLSDGYPTDALNADGSVNQGLINNQIGLIISKAPTRIKISTVYYGTINDPTAANVLQQMAQVGQGQFVNVDTTAVSTLNIQDLIQVQTGNCF